MGGMPITATWDQDSFRFYLDDAAAGSATAIAAVNTSPTNLTITSAVRVRFLIQETAGSNSSETPNFKLQYRINTGGGFGSWADIGTGSPGMTSALTIEYADGDNASQLIGAGTFRAGKLKEASSATGALTATAGSDEYEVEWCVASTSGATDGDIVELRVVVDDGDGSGFIACDTITNTPSFTLKNWSFDQDSFRWRNDDGSETTATWKAATNANPTDIGLDANVRLRFLIQELGVAPGAVLPGGVRLEFRQDTGGGFGSWTIVGSQGSGVQPVQAVLSSNFADGDATTQQIGAGTFYAGTMEEQTGAAYRGGLLTSGESEFEFCITFDSDATTPASAGDDFEFRLSSVFNGSVTTIPTITNTPSITIADGAASATGSASGSGTATAVGASTAASPGSASGSGTASATGASTAEAAASASGTGTATATGTGVNEAVGAASGAGSATGVGETITIATGAGSASGAGTASGVGAATGAGDGAASGTGTAAATGESTAESDGSSSGTGAATATGESTAEAVGSASGTGTASGVGSTETTADGVGSASGTGVASGVGEATAATVGTASGAGSAAAVGESTAEAAATASGAGAAAGVGESTAEGVGSAAGTGTATAVGEDVTGGSAVGSASGTGTAAGVGAATAEASGTAAGSGSAAAVGADASAPAAEEPRPGGGYAPWEWEKVKAAEDKRRAERDLLAAKERALEAESYDRATGEAVFAPLADADPGQKVSAGQPFDITRVSAALAPESSIDPRTAQLAARMDRLAAQVDRARRQIEKEKARVANDNEAIAALLMVI